VLDDFDRSGMRLTNCVKCGGDAYELKTEGMYAQTTHMCLSENFRWYQSDDFSKPVLSKQEYVEEGRWLGWMSDMKQDIAEMRKNADRFWFDMTSEFRDGCYNRLRLFDCISNENSK